MDGLSVTNIHLSHRKYLLVFILYFMGLGLECWGQLSLTFWNAGYAVPIGRLSETSTQDILGTAEIKVNYIFKSTFRHEVSVIAGFSSFSPKFISYEFNGIEYTTYGGGGRGFHLGAEYHYYLREYDFRWDVNNFRPYIIAGLEYSHFNVIPVKFYGTGFDLIHEIPEVKRKSMGGIIGMGLLLNSMFDVEAKIHYRPNYTFLSISIGLFRIGKYDYWW